MTSEHCKDVLQDKLVKISGSYNFPQRFLNNKNVILIWLQIHIPSFNLTMKQPATRFSSFFIPMAPAAGYQAEAFERLKEVIEIEPHGI